MLACLDVYSKIVSAVQLVDRNLSVRVQYNPTKPTTAVGRTSLCT